MIGFEPGKVFFNASAVLKAADKAAARVLGRFGSFVRRTARQSIRKRKRVSTPGSPPSSHTGILKDLIVWNYNPASQSVVVGPIGMHAENASSRAPFVLEHGGEANLWLGITKTGKVRTKRIRIKPRPYMGPALKKELPELPAMWRNSVTG